MAPAGRKYTSTLLPVSIPSALRIVTCFGNLFAVMGLLLAVWVVCYRLFFPEDFTPYAAGWASLMVATLITSGIQMFFFGVLGEYAGRTFLKVNHKPQTSIRKVLNAPCRESLPNSVL